MSAIAGCGGPRHSGELLGSTSELLTALRGFGNRDFQIVRHEDAVFGICQSTLAQPDGDSPPFVTGSRLCVADARIDNRAELIGHFGLSAAASDAELILRAWQRQGGPFGSLLGDYAYAIWDSNDQSIQLVRGPSGERPLFFTISDGCVYFATMPWALIAQPYLWQGWNDLALAAMLIGAPRPVASSYYAGIEQILPGEAVTIINSVVSKRSRWNPLPSAMVHVKLEETIDAYRTVLSASVATRLRRPSGRIAAQLSSGWDSSAVAATAAGLLDDDDMPLVGVTSAPVPSFEIPNGSRQTLDESPLAALTAAQHGIDHIIVRPERSVLALMRTHVCRYQDPNRNVVNSSWWDTTLEIARDHGATVMLTGEFGNLTINRGNGSNFGELIRTYAWRRWLVEARGALKAGDLRWTGILFHSFRHFLPTRSSQWLLDWRLRGVSDEAARLVSPALAKAAKRWVRTRSPKPIKKSQTQELVEIILSLDRGLLRKGELAAFGVDVRDPTSDERAIRFGLGLSPESLLSRGELRPMARRALSDRLPAAILANRRRGTQGADWFHTIHRREASEILEEISANETVAQLLDLPKIRRLIDDWPEADDGSFGLARIYSMRLPSALATGLFIIEAEKIAGKGSPARS